MRVCVCVCVCLNSLISHFYRFVEQWVFLGHLDCGVEFGICGNQEALTRRGEASKCYFQTVVSLVTFIHY